MESITLGDEQRKQIETLCSQIENSLEAATYEEKLSIIEMLGVRGTITKENNEKVVYIRCLLEEQQRLAVLTLPLSSEHCATGITITARLVLGFRNIQPMI